HHAVLALAAVVQQVDHGGVLTGLVGELPLVDDLVLGAADGDHVRGVLDQRLGTRLERQVRLLAAARRVSRRLELRVDQVVLLLLPLLRLRRGRRRRAARRAVAGDGDRVRPGGALVGPLLPGPGRGGLRQIRRRDRREGVVGGRLDLCHRRGGAGVVHRRHRRLGVGLHHHGTGHYQQRRRRGPGQRERERPPLLGARLGTLLCSVRGSAALTRRGVLLRSVRGATLRGGRRVPGILRAVRDALSLRRVSGTVLRAVRGT